MKIWIEDNPTALAEAVAEHIASYIRNHPGTLMCFAAGDTPLQMLGKLVEKQRRGEVDLSSVRYVGLDEWAGIGYETKGSCCQVMRDSFYEPAGIAQDHMLLWNGKAENPDRECERIDAWIRDCGGIGLALLGIGMNGHVGFNEPGAPTDAPCQIVKLDGVTASVGRKYFGGAECPAYGMTIGMPRLMQSEEMILMATGEHKAPILRKALMEQASGAVPASLLQAHPKLMACMDRDAWHKL